MTISFEGRVAIVTGAGNGLGRAHALGLAARGAKVVVNDLGTARDGNGGSSAAAEKVVEEIRAAGGQAIADGANVADFSQVQAMTAMVKREWGRDRHPGQQCWHPARQELCKNGALADFRTVMDVHLMGSVHCTRSVWDIMREQNYGRIVMTTSSSGLYGNFGQSNYGSAKAGVIGLMNVLAQEGRKNDIRVNTLSPTAATRMTEDLISADMLALMTPESITPGLLYLVSQDAPTRTILCAGAGAFAVARIVETKGAYIPENERTPETVAARFAEIADTTEAQALESALQQTDKFVNMAAKAKGIRLGTRIDDPR